MKIRQLANICATAILTLGLATSCGNSDSNTATPNSESQASTTPADGKNQTAGKPRPSTVKTEQSLPKVFYSEEGLAIRGTDPVAYFTQSKPVKGQPEFSYKWGNATWQFASAENRDLFMQNPEKYAPQYGGFCAWAVSQGYTASTDPNAWKIENGKLYLNYNSAVQWGWEKDVSGNVAKGDKNWPELAKDKDKN
ncbi:MAG: YHS domain-containing protein [Microcoleus sp. CSU_2_2]|nr:YHS domain-containing protein [Microcoleus sp. SU_5_3]NJS11029.1 YHS domain-containing protein [Microcoleus sp. CSU_2_2]